MKLKEMTLETFKGKAIYSPKGKAAEYGKYAFSAYVGCSCGCHYCFNKTGRFKAVLGGDKPALKKCFKSEEHAIEVFEKELKANLPELQKHGLFFSFTTDPLLPETAGLTQIAVELCAKNDVPVKILTKKTDLIFGFLLHTLNVSWKNIAFGFTLTGHDELEPNASPNAERIEEMKRLHNAGFKTFASIEPVIDFNRSLDMIKQTSEFCDLYKIGLESGKGYNRLDINIFMERVYKHAYLRSLKIYFKDSLLKAAGVKRENLPASCVTRDYNLF